MKYEMVKCDFCGSTEQYKSFEANPLSNVPQIETCWWKLTIDGPVSVVEKNICPACYRKFVALCKRENGGAK